MKYNSVKNQNIKRKLVEREVIHCLSYTVSELQKNAEHFPDYYDDLMNMYQGYPDYELALESNGYEQYYDKYNVECWKDSYDLSMTGTAQQVIEKFRLDDDFDLYSYAPEILEYWAVSKWFGEKLEEQGEKVIYDFFDFDAVWCRSCSGQAILLDYVIGKIANDMEILEGQINEWK